MSDGKDKVGAFCSDMAMLLARIVCIAGAHGFPGTVPARTWALPSHLTDPAAGCSPSPNVLDCFFPAIPLEVSQSPDHCFL